MVRRCAGWLALWCLLAGGCGGESTQPPLAEEPEDPEPVACAAGELRLENGGCVSAGIPPEACAEGFTPDAVGGCMPILPSAPCIPGTMAIPGETACHALADCGAGPWPDVSDAEAQHVDASYDGISDGTQLAPWKTIQEGVDAAGAGGLVLVAAGSYVESVVIMGSPRRIVGRCPDMVEIVGSAVAEAAVQIRSGSSGSELARLALRGASRGVLVTGSEDVILDRLWIHETGARGLVATTLHGPTSLVLRDSLIESATSLGLFSIGAFVDMQRSVIRNTQPDPGSGGDGRGANLSGGTAGGQRARLVMQRSVIEANHDHGIYVACSDLEVEGSVIRGTLPDQGDQLTGRGINAQGSDGNRPWVSVRSSVIVDNHDYGIFILGGDLTVETTVVAAHKPRASDADYGWGISVAQDGEWAASGVVRQSVVAANHQLGIGAFGAPLTLHAVQVRDTQPRALDARHGRGVVVQNRPQTMTRAAADVVGCVVANNHEFGIFVEGSDAAINATRVSDTMPRAMDGFFGRGISVQGNPASWMRGNAAILDSVVERSHDGGLVAVGADASITNTTVSDTAVQPFDGGFGDGIGVATYPGFAIPYALIAGCRVERNSRAGIAVFGANVELRDCVMDCNFLALNGEEYITPFRVDDRGGNVCGCGDEQETCAVLSSGLAPPEASAE